MSDAVDRGITVTEIAPMEQAIDVAPETTVAFVGRALRGPLNTPLLVRHFGEFRRRFGGAWSRSSLAPAVRQFFEHGGQQLHVVRVANNARGAMLCLPASGSALVLRAVEPGSTERIRAAIDYDGIADDAEHFNLTLQRVDPGSGMIVDQEMFRNLSHDPDTDNFVANVLTTSSIARVEQPFPTHRPDATLKEDSRFELTWIEPVQDGIDGVELSDYDLIGSRSRATGMFALQQLEHFDLLYLPPTGKGRDTGPAAVLAAEQYCRQRGAMLLIDPPGNWESAGDAVDGVRESGYSSPNMLTYFPRVYFRDDDDRLARVAGAAFAGLLCKHDRTRGPWRQFEDDGIGFARNIRPVFDLDDEDEHALARAGINCIVRGAAGRARIDAARTLARGSESHRVFMNLPVRRLCLRIVGSIDLATRWAVFEKPDEALTQKIRAQIVVYLNKLAELGALANARFVVQCDAGVAHHEDPLRHGVTILLVFQPIGSAIPVSFTIHQTVSGCRVTSTAFAPIADDCA